MFLKAIKNFFSWVGSLFPSCFKAKESETARAKTVIERTEFLRSSTGVISCVVSYPNAKPSKSAKANDADTHSSSVANNTSASSATSEVARSFTAPKFK